jgi:predicted Ser/Thr protein kinase
MTRTGSWLDVNQYRSIGNFVNHSKALSRLPACYDSGAMAQEQQTTRCPQCGKAFPVTVKLCPDDGAVLEHEPPAATQVGKVLDGKYRLDAFLSQGGMGAVYRATHVMLNKTVAVKLINPELVTSPDVVRRFQREARAATALNHPNIVSVYDLGQTTEGTLYIAMEFVDGPSLKSVIESGGPLQVMRTLTLARQLASALSAAHRQGIIHRDLKPHNVMLARSQDGQEIAKLVDFGIAKTFDEGTQLTIAGFSPGTPQYMAPEQAGGRAVDARSDLYSFGVILYEMLAGFGPFKATSAASVLIKHIIEEPVPPSVKNPRVAIPAQVEAIVLRCMAKDPAERFQTADELGRALEESAVALAGSAPAQAALPMGTPSAVVGGSSATTLTAAVVSPPKPAPPVRAQQAAPPQAHADTRPTAAAPAPDGGAAPAALAAPSRKSSASPVFVIFVVLMAAGAAAIIYLNYFRTPMSQSATTTPPVEPPPASPAMVSQNEPTPLSQPPAPSQGSATDGTAAKSAAAKADLANPTPATSQTSPPGTSARPAAANAKASTAQGASVAGPEATATGSSARAPVTSREEPAGRTRQEPAGRTRQEPAARAPVTTRKELTGRAREEPAGRARQEPAGQAAAGAIPESPAVFFQCAGVSEVCSPLRAAVDEALEKGGLSSVRNPARANITVLTRVEILQERVDRQFQTTFAVRNYSIEVSAETTSTSETVTMPPTTTLSFDPQFGSERSTEKARLIAGDVVDRIKAFVHRKRGA